MKEYEIEYTVFYEINKEVFNFYVMAENEIEARSKFVDLRGKRPKIISIKEIYNPKEMYNSTL